MTNKLIVETKQGFEAESIKSVFEYLSIKDLKNASLTCKNWERLSRDRRFSAVELSLASISIMDALGKRTIIYNEEYKIKAVKEVGKFCDTCNIYGYLTKTFTTDYSLNKESIENLISPLSNIVNFILHICIIEVDCLEAYLQPLKNIRELCLSNVEIVNNDSSLHRSVSFLDTLKVLFVDRVSDKSIVNFDLCEYGIDTKSGFLCPDSSPGFELFQNDINVQLGILNSGSSLECLMNHNIIEELFFYNSHISLLKPFTKFYPTLKKIATANYYQPILSQELLKIIQNNPQLSSIHIYTCETPKMFIEAVLEYISNIVSFAIYSANNFEFSYYGNYLDFCNRYFNYNDLLALNYTNSDLYFYTSKLIKRIQNLTLINVTLNSQYYSIMQLIANEAKNLTALVLYSPFFGYKNARRVASMKSFFENIFYCLKFKSYESLKSIEFIEFNILYFKIKYLSQFKNLSIVKFQYLLNFESREEELQEINSNLEVIKGWKILHDYSIYYGTITYQRNYWIE